MMSVNDNSRGFAQVQCAAIISQSIPLDEDITLGSRCETSDRWKFLHPPMIKLRCARNLRLLRHYFRDENSIGIRRLSPWEIFFMRSIPRKDFAMKEGALHSMQSVYCKYRSAGFEPSRRS